MDSPARSLRLFFALWPDAPALARLARLSRDVAEERHGRPPAEANLHVTMAFVGPVAQSRVPAIAQAGAAASAAVPAFTLTLDRVGGTAHGIAWLAPSDAPAELQALHEALARALAAAGITLEPRPFRPHVTLARRCARSPRRMPATPVQWRVDAMSLVASTTGPAGSRYDDLASWRLRGGNDQSTGTV